MNREKQLNRTMKELNIALRNSLNTIRKPHWETLYKLFLQNFIKGPAQTLGLLDEVGVIIEMPLACHLRRFRINSIK